MPHIPKSVVVSVLADEFGLSESSMRGAMRHESIRERVERIAEEGVEKVDIGRLHADIKLHHIGEFKSGGVFVK